MEMAGVSGFEPPTFYSASRRTIQTILHTHVLDNPYFVFLKICIRNRKRVRMERKLVITSSICFD